MYALLLSLIFILLTSPGVDAGMTYDEATSKISVAGYTEIAPAGFADFSTEDRAGSAELLAAEACGINHTLTYQVRPVEARAIPINFVLNGATTGAGDTLDVTGTDWDGVVRVDNIDVSASGTSTYNSGVTKWRTITDIDCTGWADGTIQVTQDQWGVVWDHGSRTYAFDCKVRLLNGSWFVGVKKNIIVREGVLSALGDIFWDVQSGANCTFGKGDTTDKYGYDGINWTIINATGHWLTYAFRQESNSVFNIYDCHLLFPEGAPINNRKCVALHTAEDNMYSCSISNSHFGINRAKGSMDINHVDFNGLYGPIVRFGESGSGGGINNTNLMHAYNAFYFQHGVGVTVEIENIFMLDITRLYCHASFDGVANIVNLKSAMPGWIYWQGGSDGIINVKYPFAVFVGDKDTELESGVSVVLNRSDLVKDPSGTSEFLVVADYTAGTAGTTPYLQGGDVSGDTLFAFNRVWFSGSTEVPVVAAAFKVGQAYVAGEEVFNLLTAADGAIASQEVISKSYTITSGSGPLHQYMHELEFSKSGKWQSNHLVYVDEPKDLWFEMENRQLRDSRGKLYQRESDTRLRNR